MLNPVEHEQNQWLSQGVTVSGDDGARIGRAKEGQGGVRNWTLAIWCNTFFYQIPDLRLNPMPNLRLRYLLSVAVSTECVLNPWLSLWLTNRI